MYVINQEAHIVNEWADTEINRQRLSSGKYGVTEFTGEFETVNGIMYEKGFAPQKTLGQARASKLSELNAAFSRASETAHCLSSVGFEINADETANRNIEGLTLVLEPGESTLFRAYDNSFHEVTKEQLETMRREIVKNSQWLYQAKWTVESQVESAETIEALEAIVITTEALTTLANSLEDAENPEGNANEQTV